MENQQQELNPTSIVKIKVLGIGGGGVGPDFDFVLVEVPVFQHVVGKIDQDRRTGVNDRRFIPLSVVDLP